MKQFVMILFVTMFSLVSLAQKETVANKDTSKRIFIPYDLNPLKNINNNLSSFSLYSFGDLRKMSSPVNLFHDSLYISEMRFTSFYPDKNKMVFVDKTHYMYVKDPLKPYGGGVGSTLLFGTLNYLFLLINGN